jgi:hypothetical protein
MATSCPEPDEVEGLLDTLAEIDAGNQGTQFEATDADLEEAQRRALLGFDTAAQTES